MPTQMLPTRPPGSWTCLFFRVDVEIPAVVGRRELVSAVLLDLGRVAPLEVVADGGLDLAGRRVETQAEDARAHIGVEPPRKHVHCAALAQQWASVAIRGDGDLGRAKLGHRQGRRPWEGLSRDRGLRAL